MPVLKLEQADIHYEVHGKGPPLLLISGTTCDGDFWKPHQVDDLSRDFSVIIFDQRGTGKTINHTDDYATTSLAADAAALIAHIGLGPAAVLGHSMGGRVAQHVALDHRPHVSKLILASTGASFKMKGGLAPAMCLAIIKLGYERYIREHTIKIGFSKAYIAAHPDRVDAFMNQMLAALPPIEIYFAHVMSRQAHDTSARLRDIAVPTLVMVGGDETHGSSDTTHVQSSQALANGIPNAQFVVLEKQGHFYTFSDAANMNKIVRDFISTSAA